MTRRSWSRPVWKRAIIEKDELSFDTDAIRDSVAEKFKDDWGDIFQEIMEYLGKA